ncbi:MAG TPA: hypothetical protein VNO32_31880 [Candidatus Acidoferrum sp.]|jgi:hypothetical protein|nr:hypothetical protein [Candidatus Acidoferrum sp.]
MKELLTEALSLVEAEASWLHAAALYFEQHASKLIEDEKAEWQLLAAVYRERAQASQIAVEKVRQSLATDGSSALHSGNA